MFCLRRWIALSCFFLLVLAAAPLMTTPAAACGPDTDCVLSTRIYRIAMPEGHDGKAQVGAIIYMHGYRGTASGAIKNQGLRRIANELGVALVTAKSFAANWALPNAPSSKGDGSVEIAYFEALIDDIARRFPIDKTRLLATGFSAGGMMTWTLACSLGQSFMGFAPIAGTFWDPVPDTCDSGPVNLIHYHGTSDKVVPLLGRKIADTKQGEVPAALELMRGTGTYSPVERSTDGDLTCELQRDVSGSRLEFCTHGGGHHFSARYIKRAWEIFARE